MHLRIKSVLRKIRLALKTVRGMLFLSLGLFILVMWISPLVLLQILPANAFPIDEGSIRDLVPASLLAACILTVLLGDDKAIRFDPAEVDLLFAGPFTRGQLLNYKLLTHVFGAIAAGTFFSVWMIARTTCPFSAWIGCVLSIWFVQLFQMAFVLLCHTLSTGVFVHLRRFLIGIMILLGAGIVCYLAFLAPPGNVWASFKESFPGTVLLFPFRVFGNTITARTLFPELLTWGSLALCVNLSLMLLVKRLDRSYLEAALTSSQKFYSMIQRGRRGGALALMVTPFGSSIKMPRFPHFFGAGPIAHRQLTSALRSLPTLIGIVGISIFSLAAPRMLMVNESEEGNILALTTGVAVIQLTFVFTMLLRFDFRADLPQMDQLKALPFSSNAIALGEIAAPIMLATVVQIILLLGIGAAIPVLRLLCILACCYTLPANLLLFGLENFLFLMFPSKSVVFNPGDIQGFGHQIILFIVKLVMMGCALTFAFGIAALIMISLNAPRYTFFILSWVLTALLGIGCIPLIGWAFTRFDPSSHQPS